MKKNMALFGPPGCGKTAAVNMVISGLQVKTVPQPLPASYTFRVPQPSKETPFGAAVVVQYMSVNPWTPLGTWEKTMQRGLIRSSQNGMRPMLGAWSLFFVDDCHAGSEPLQEAWRFFLEHKLV